MDWRTFLQPLSPSYTPGNPAAPADLDRLESELDCRLPNDYREFMLQIGGIDDEYECPVIDSLPDVLHMNRVIRRDGNDRFNVAEYVFISSAYGNGDLVGYRVRGGENPSALYKWDHETDEIEPKAPDLKTWLTAFMSGPTGDDGDE
jgi:hypothetical protein